MDRRAGPPARARSPWTGAGEGRREPSYGFERLSSVDRPRHIHGSAYATVVLSGAFVQTGYTGRYRVEAGDVVVQPTLDRHADWMISPEIDIVRLPWTFDAGSGAVWRGCDVDEIRRAAGSDLDEAVAILRRGLSVAGRLAPIVEHRPDRFFTDLARDLRVGVRTWASANALSREVLSRGLQRLYGVSPTALRSELRARAAWRSCVEGLLPLADIALDSRFADQAHMTRSVRRLTGATPAQWRMARRRA